MIKYVVFNPLNDQDCERGEAEVNQLLDERWTVQAHLVHNFGLNALTVVLTKPKNLPDERPKVD
jgi:hypothetical protein